MLEYSRLKKINIFPRLPLEGSLDLTYRCNNNCLHCWLRIPSDSPEKQNELTLDEIKSIADQARSMGCRRWNISGGEPILRPDFQEIFEYLTAKSAGYTLNTNGTLITPEIAQLLKRKGTKMVALYGATKETYDRVTRHPGGFEMVMRGFRYLQEAGAGFIVQLIPMRDNWHEWDSMLELAQKLSPNWRIGAAWLYLSSSGSEQRNREIAEQRLSPRDVVELDKPDLCYEEWIKEIGDGKDNSCHARTDDDRLFAKCAVGRREFHIDPYGGMTFCCFHKDPAMRFDLRRRGSFKEAWEKFIPSLANKVHGGEEYNKNCRACKDRDGCEWCPVFGWLEHGRFSAPVEYICNITSEKKRFKDDWLAHYRRYFRIAGITIQVDSDLKINDQTFHLKFASFRTDGPGKDMVKIRHHFGLPDLKGKDLGQELYRKPPWAISQQNGSYVYLGISNKPNDQSLHRVATFNVEHTRAHIFNERQDNWRKGDLHSLTMFPSDQILIARLLADRQGFYLHSAGAILNGQGMLFVGHSDAGKSTTTKVLIDAGKNRDLQVEILCDDRNIVRRMEDGWRVYGTWSHGDVPVVSANDAPLGAICFIEKAKENKLIPLTDRKEIIRRLLACVIKPFITADWWQKTLNMIEQIAKESTYYVMRFDKSSDIIYNLKDIIFFNEENKAKNVSEF